MPNPGNAASPSRTARWVLWGAMPWMTAALALACVYSNLADSQHVWIFIVAFGALAGPAFLIIAWKRPAIGPSAFWTGSISWRVLLLLAMAPGADIFRYIWEGSVLLNGFSPYAHAPNAQVLAPLRGMHWHAIEHPGISAIYPPLTQLGFAAIAWISPTVLAFKTAFVLADLAVCWLLARRFSHRDAALYAWNPAVLYAVAGGGHYDSWLALALVGAWLLWTATPARPLAACLCLGAGVSIKWIVLPILAWCIWRLTRERGLTHAFRGVVLGAAPFLITWPIASLGFQGSLIPTDFAQYARSAELIPRLAAWLWPASAHSNVYLLLPLAVCGVLLLVSTRKFMNFSEIWVFLLLVFTPVFHIWYVVWLAPFAVGTRNPGTLLFSVSAFGYFYLYTFDWERMTGYWELPIPILLVTWLPLVLGFAWHFGGAPRFSRKVT